MRHNDIDIKPTLSPEQAVALYKNRTISDIHTALNTYEEFYKQKFSRYTDNGRGDTNCFMKCAMACIWNAGRVEGIRMERARRKNT